MRSRRIFCAAAALLTAASAFAIEVNRPELESTANSSGVVFQNYSGPHTVINTVDQIRQIGATLGSSVAASNVDNPSTAGSANRYYVIHAVDPNEGGGKLDADIFIIGADASVDHITNVRRIISAYLTSAYGYSRSDADTIATYVTVYNAVYRGNTGYFGTKYKKVVTDSITAARVGISMNYQEWPGATQLVIPLSDVRGGLSTVDTSTISDREVVKSLQNEDDKGIDTRKSMVDIKEREADNAQDAADAAAQRAAEEAAKLKAEQEKQAQANKDAADAKKDANAAQKSADSAQKSADSAQKSADSAQAKADSAGTKADGAQTAADSAQKDADAAKKAAEDAQKRADANPDDPAAQAAAAKAWADYEKAQKDADAKQAEADKARADYEAKQAEADKAKADADAKQAEADKAKADAEAKKADAEQKQTAADAQAQKTSEQADKANKAAEDSSTAQAKADQKRSEAQDDRSTISKDQQEIIRNEADADNAANANVVFGLKSIDDLGAMSAIVKVNSETGAIIKESPVSVIRSRTVYEDGDTFVAIAGTNFGNGAIKLVVIDKNTLEIIKESAETLSETSVLVEYEGYYYCVVNGTDGFVIGKYNENAENLLKSPVAVKAATPITITASGILATARDGKPVLLNLKDLTAVTK